MASTSTSTSTGIDTSTSISTEPPEELRDRDVTNLDITNASAVEPILSAYVKYSIGTWMQDVAFLWEDFYNFFLGWTAQHFRILSKELQTELRNTLRAQGVWIRIGRGRSIADALYDCLLEKEQHVWTQEEL